jgi:hypothetical protein
VSEVLGELSSLFTLAFSFTTMLSMGLGLTVAEIVTPLRNLRFVGAALAVNFLLVPAAAMLLAPLVGLSADLRIGLLLIACAAGAPMVPKLVQIAKGDAATVVALTTLLIVATVGFLPLALPILLPGVVVESGGIARSLATQMLLPLVMGVFVRERYEEEAAAYRTTVAQISSVSLALLILTSLGQNLPSVFGLIGSWGHSGCRVADCRRCYRRPRVCRAGGSGGASDGPRRWTAEPGHLRCRRGELRQPAGRAHLPRDRWADLDGYPVPARRRVREAAAPREAGRPARGHRPSGTVRDAGCRGRRSVGARSLPILAWVPAYQHSR